MTWNYRIAKNQYGELFIIEVYYDEDGKAELWSGAIKPYGNDLEDLMRELDSMLGAFKRPIFETIVKSEVK